jgi:endonuclease YncB( thermonuclease family)
MIKVEPPQRGLLARLRRFFRFYRRGWQADHDAFFAQQRRDIARALLRAGYIRDPEARAELEELLDQAEGQARDKQASNKYYKNDQMGHR